MLQNSPLYSYIPARDVRRARTFYERTLGFKSKIEINGGVVYEFAKGTACFLYPTPNAGTSQASQAFWEVDDIEREVAELKARGVVFENYDMPGDKSPSGVVTSGGAKAAWFKDSEGNILAIIQTL
jgi:predicted enzyme related to lactoylglutathione lyase